MRILFLCTHNACRSIIAEAIARAHFAGEHEFASAGSAPSGTIHPVALRYIESQGVNTDMLISQSLHDFENWHPDCVITLCDSAAQEACPVWSNGVRYHWPLQDPSRCLSEDQTHSACEKVKQLVITGLEKLIQEKQTQGVQPRGSLTTQ